MHGTTQRRPLPDPTASRSSPEEVVGFAALAKALEDAERHEALDTLLPLAFDASCVTR